MSALRILIVDNYDSFTYNLAHAFARLTGEMPAVARNDAWDWDRIASGGFDAIVISPGPGHPGNARDFGVSADVVRHATVPVLGVCLGHQGIALEFGGGVDPVEPAHGMPGEILHDGSDELLRGLPLRFRAIRYHSLAVAEPLPDVLRKIAWTPDGMTMALRHGERPMWGVQFHPESILSEYGTRLLRNFLDVARAHGSDGFPYADEPNSFWLWSLMGRSDEVVSYDAGLKEVTVSVAGAVRERRSQTLFDYLDEVLKANRGRPGGYVGYFGYELRADCGSAVSHRSGFPDAMLMRVDDPLPAGSMARSGVGIGGQRVAPVPRLTRSDYVERVGQCLERIREGEAYELCLTNQLEFASDVPALRYYEKLRALNPAPYSAYLRFRDLEIACSSPECFLRIDGNGRVESRPIKGTLPRGRNAQEDTLLRELLATDPRFRAENLMITDLVRNDLGRVAVPGSVHVPGLMEVESYATVHQLVSTVAAQLRPGATVVDCLRSVFPAGSMTGAPKLRAMEILDGLEAGWRGIYSGSVGYLGFDGTAELNVVIRTAVFHKGRVSIGTGGAVVAQSDPAAEWDETQLKAAALLRAFVA